MKYTIRSPIGTELKAVVQPIEDGLLDTDAGRNWNDWTPMERRILARQVSIDGHFGRLSLTEEDKTNPRTVHLYLTAHDVHTRHSYDTELDMTLSNAALDDLIAALTFARDTAVAEWMLEPTAPSGMEGFSERLMQAWRDYGREHGELVVETVAKKVAKKSGKPLSTEFLYKWLTGKAVPTYQIPQLAALADFLGVDIRWLVGWDRKPQ